MCTRIGWSFDSNQRALTKDLIRQMVHCCRSLGRNHRPGNPDRSSSRSASLGAKFVRPALSDAHVLSTLLPEAVVGLTRSSQAQPLTSKRRFWPPKPPKFPAAERDLAVENPAAGNGIFGCRDERLKTALKNASRNRARTNSTLSAIISAGTAYP